MMRQFHKLSPADTTDYRQIPAGHKYLLLEGLRNASTGMFDYTLNDLRLVAVGWNYETALWQLKPTGEYFFIEFSDSEFAISNTTLASELELQEAM